MSIFAQTCCNNQSLSAAGPVHAAWPELIFYKFEMTILNVGLIQLHKVLSF